jgi:hypothetical protein
MKIKKPETPRTGTRRRGKTDSVRSLRLSRRPIHPITPPAYSPLGRCDRKLLPAADSCCMGNQPARAAIRFRRSSNFLPIYGVCATIGPNCRKAVIALSRAVFPLDIDLYFLHGRRCSSTPSPAPANVVDRDLDSDRHQESVIRICTVSDYQGQSGTVFLCTNYFGCVSRINSARYCFHTAAAVCVPCPRVCSPIGSSMNLP